MDAAVIVSVYVRYTWEKWKIRIKALNTILLLPFSATQFVYIPQGIEFAALSLCNVAVKTLCYKLERREFETRRDQ
jgi:hypothetical protein